ncbi:unnamed protein product [Caenorhabditis angaria]|uniref:phospholipase A2 n=1 Tax=Caenorhabditis angaria TaxID=860376 RepID=A0A9P1IXJ4_9PELO|nr:unnamed protein product [Caenorhabditis angaria]
MAFTQLTWKDFLKTFEFVDQAFDSVVNMITGDGNEDGSSNDSSNNNSETAILTAGSQNTAVVLKRKRRSDSNYEEASTSKKSSSEDDGSDKEDLGALRFLSSITSVIINPLRRSIYSGDDSWVPADCEQLAEFPKELLDNYKKVHPNVEAPQKYNLVNGDFAVLVSKASLDEAGSKRKTKSEQKSREEVLTNNPLNASAEKTPSAEKTSKEEIKEKTSSIEQIEHPLHHLAITLYDEKNSKYVVSLFRSHNFENVVALCERCRENPELFRSFPRDVDIKEYLLTIFNELRENMTWKTVHIAAKIGLIEYFEEMKEHKRKRYFNMIAQPEGLNALMIAVQNDQLETVKLMLEQGADINIVSQEGENILHIAALSSMEMIKFLWETKKCATMLNKSDAAGNSPMYIALTNGYLSNARLLKNLGATLTAAEATHEATPLIGSVKRGKLDVATLKKILEIKPDAFEEVEPTTGNSVLHCVTTKRCLVMLMEKYKDKVNTSACNNLKQNPIHVFAAKEEIGLVMTICSFSADIDVQDGNGNTPLHYAVTKGNLDMTRQLLCLGADPNKLNHFKESPRHIAARFSEKQKAVDMVRSLIICGAKTCDVGFVGCAFGCMNREGIGAYRAHITSEDEKIKNAQVAKDATTGAYEFELDPDTHVLNEAYAEKNEVRDFPHKMALERVKEKLEQLAKKQDKSNIVNVLALDGGGIRGLVTVQMLIALEKYLDKPLIEYFDWIGATSTGSYIMSTLLVGQNIRQAQRYYLQFKDLLFDSWKRPYDANILEGLMKRLFGENLKMGEVKYPKIFCTTVRADTFPVQLDLCRSYRLPLTDKENDELGFKDPNELTLWKACRRSSAAPTYFSASEGKYIDGGMISNNPTLDLLSEICFWNTTCQKSGNNGKVVDIGCVLSVGTGVTPVSPVDPSVFEMNDLMGLLRGIRNLSLVVIDQATATEGAPITRSRSWCHSLGAPYFRLNAPIFKDIILDTNDDLDLAKIMWDSVVYSHTHRKDFEEIANLLKMIGTTEERKKYL